MTQLRRPGALCINALSLGVSTKRRTIEVKNANFKIYNLLKFKTFSCTFFEENNGSIFTYQTHSLCFRLLCSVMMEYYHGLIDQNSGMKIEPADSLSRIAWL